MGPQTQAAKEAAAKEKKEAERKEARQQVRDMDRAARKIEREITKLQNQEQKQLKEVAALAKKGQHGPAKMVAKQVATTRKLTTQMYTMNA